MAMVDHATPQQGFETLALFADQMADIKLRFKLYNVHVKDTAESNSHIISGHLRP